MSLTRVFTAGSGRISADFRKDETESTRGIGEVFNWTRHSIVKLTNSISPR